jgi:hypothetical protein
VSRKQSNRPLGLKYKERGTNQCSRCENDRAENSRYCRECRKAYNRERRKTVPMTPEQRRKDIARSYAGVYKKRGKLVQEPCVKCGDQNSQMHHLDYSKPLEVIWLCRKCHLSEHTSPSLTKDFISTVTDDDWNSAR